MFKLDLCTAHKRSIFMSEVHVYKHFIPIMIFSNILHTAVIVIWPHIVLGIFFVNTLSILR